MPLETSNQIHISCVLTRHPKLCLGKIREIVISVSEKIGILKM